MSYAKAAVWDIIGRLNERDRFALISFADHAVVQSPLMAVNAANKGFLNNIVSEMIPSGGTNMGEGLSAVLSTIGMGLGFNESLMSKLADYGMGRYANLEDLSGLSEILNRYLKNTRNIYANSSTLEIHPGNGMNLIDAGGYPLNRLNATTISIPTGQLLAGTAKHFVMTFTIPSTAVGSVELGDIRLNYSAQGKAQQISIEPSNLTLAVVAPELKQQALKSIDKDVYRQSWLDNNLGIVKKKISGFVRSGNRPAPERK